MTQIKTLILIIILTFICVRSYADERHNVAINFNFYPYLSDVGSDSDFTLTTGTQLFQNTSYYGFINFGHLFDRSNDFRLIVSEQKIRWDPFNGLPLGLEEEYKIRGNGPDDFQSGLRWRVHDTSGLSYFLDKLNLSYSITLFLHKYGKTGLNLYQVSHVYRIDFPYISKRLFLSGFIDHTIFQDVPVGVSKHPIISETQINYLIYNKLYAIAEYRINQYRKNNVDNLTIGFEIKSNWEF